MSSEDGDYCSICGGIPPDKINTKQVLIDGKATGIENLDFILDNVRELNLTNHKEIVEEIMVRVKKFNYIPTKKEDAYAVALIEEYMKV
jgi:hypothetical protein